MRKIGIINGGGDCAGINAVIASAVKSGKKYGYTFYGFEKGWTGVLDMNYRILDEAGVRGISHLGGTILKTQNKGKFTAIVGVGQKATYPPELIQAVLENLKKLEIDTLLMIGGDGTMAGALQFVPHGINMVGVPKTIDNDLKSTDRTFGFNTAVDVVVEALDRIHTTAYSHDRVIIVETMGRYTGWIALYGGLAGGADAILLPEFPFSVQGVVDFLRKRRSHDRNYSVIVIGEGAKVETDEVLIKKTDQSQGESKLGGAAETLMKNIEKVAPEEFEMRHVVLGHTQRGGTPNADDRILALSYGHAATEAIHQGKFGHLVVLQGGKISTVPMDSMLEGLKGVTHDNEAFQTAKDIGIYMGE